MKKKKERKNAWKLWPSIKKNEVPHSLTNKYELHKTRFANKSLVEALGVLGW